MIGRGQVEAQHPEDRPQKALRLTTGQVKDQAERQRGFDGNLGVLQLPSALADAHGLPRGDRFRRQPQGDVASLDQCSVVRRPVSDAVFRFVPGMHSRLHVEIMPLRPSRWPGPRRTLVSAHQRHQSAAGSLAEGLDETLTLHRLGVYGVLGRSLKTTNGLESINALIEERCAKVDHWQNSSQRPRWLATALLDIEPRLRKVMGYRHLPKLRDAMKRELKIDTTTSKKKAA